MTPFLLKADGRVLFIWSVLCRGLPESCDNVERSYHVWQSHASQQQHLHGMLSVNSETWHSVFPAVYSEKI